MAEIEAYSSATGTSYPNWGALVEAEANGYVVVALITSTRNEHLKSWPWIVGTFDDRAEAMRYRNRTRAKWKRETEQWPHLSYKFFVRPAWKPELH